MCTRARVGICAHVHLNHQACACFKSACSGPSHQACGFLNVCLALHGGGSVAVNEGVRVGRGGARPSR
eukprot:3191215-Alexandrium_andersonii.AAC.1